MAKADRKHRWIRTGTVQLPPFEKFEKMLDEGEKFVESNKWTTGVCWRKCASVVGKRHRHICQRSSGSGSERIWSFKSRITFERQSMFVNE